MVAWSVLGKVMARLLAAVAGVAWNICARSMLMLGVRVAVHTRLHQAIVYSKDVVVTYHCGYGQTRLMQVKEEHGARESTSR